MQRTFPQYLSKPYQILWFEPDDIAIAVGCYLLVMLFGGVTWILLIVVPWTYSRMKNKYPRGFLRHGLYFIGLVELKGYPSPFEEEFTE
jgi:hypothetical protein